MKVNREAHNSERSVVQELSRWDGVGVMQYAAAAKVVGVAFIHVLGIGLASEVLIIT